MVRASRAFESVHPVYEQSVRLDSPYSLDEAFAKFIDHPFDWSMPDNLRLPPFDAFPEAGDAYALALCKNRIGVFKKSKVHRTLTVFNAG